MKSMDALRCGMAGGRIPFLLAWMLLLSHAAPAALTTAPGNSQNGAPAPPEIRDIVPPIDVFPYPLWMVVLAAALGLAIVIIVIVLLVRAVGNRPPPRTLTAREAAMKELHALEDCLDQLEPYEFSIAVSEVLRRFIGQQFGLHALRQTSPEFLTAVSNSPRFSEADRTLLTGFLEECDMIKFARIHATREESSGLLGSAIAFVEGSRA